MEVTFLSWDNRLWTETLNVFHFLFSCAGEERNFALFNFVNEQNNEAEALRDQINQVSVFSQVINGNNKMWQYTNSVQPDKWQHVLWSWMFNE